MLQFLTITVMRIPFEKVVKINQDCKNPTNPVTCKAARGVASQCESLVHVDDPQRCARFPQLLYVPVPFNFLGGV